MLTVRAFREFAAGSSLTAIQSVLSTSAIYEIIEWLVTAMVDPALGSEFVGAQGDDGFDAAKDMALAFLGSTTIFFQNVKGFPKFCARRHGGTEWKDFGTQSGKIAPTTKKT